MFVVVSSQKMELALPQQLKIGSVPLSSQKLELTLP